METITKHLIAFWNSFRNSFKLFQKHDTLSMGAALAYYTGFSLIPIIIIVLSIAGSVLGPQAAQGEIKMQLQSLLGAKSAEQLEGLVMAGYEPGKNFIATTVAILLLLVGATSVFSQVHTSFNLIWNVKPVVKQPIIRFFIQRLFSFAMIVSLAFLLLVSFLAHAALAVLTNYLNHHLPQTSVMLITVMDFLISYAFTTLLFGMVFKYMSDAEPKWRLVWPGALFTALLFAIGKYLMSFYLTNYNFDDTYGAAGSIVLLLTWVFYSSQILFFGAEFIHALAAEHGVLLDPLAVAKDANVGIETKHVLDKK